MSPQKTGKTIQSVQRAVDIINCFRDMNTALSLGQISSQLTLNKSTVHGILNTLLQNDFIQQNAKGQYMLGPCFIRKFGAAQRSLHALLKDCALDGMVRFANKYRVSCGLFKVELGGLTRVNWIQPQDQNFTIISHATYINALYSSASGKIVLAHMSPEALEEYMAANPLLAHTSMTVSNRLQLLEALEAVRRDGYSTENEEQALDVYALSAPIYNGQGELFATVSATGTASYICPYRNSIAADLKDLAQDITRQVFG